ncbi:EAL domain-containing protein [Brevundimonas sp. S30B]|uniref:EAL domain-containing protein n=1 Tax=unclassified Brevundimonas TaxID=2622653 RepID=UPI001072875F|nr:MULTISPECIES: EAL domain-containing protein [unclassified Brevundimonas]QBX38036.1 EAL domain-containing protein [Brevundimonas sp. MF30-B]TFW02610.1 EAL domain-containing protein [Brevundimonas sp. S30B]
MSRFRPPPPGSIGRRLILLVLAALTASFVVTMLISTWMDLNRQAALETGRLTQTARVIASLSVEAVVENDRGRAFQAVRSIAQMPGVSYARVDDAGGAMVAETGSGARLVTDASASGGGDPSLWSLLNTGSLEARAPILAQDQTVGSVTVFGQTPELRHRLLSTLWATLAGALAALLAGLFVATRMGRRIARPITALAELIRGVDKSGDYSTAVDIEAEGEVAELVSGFDTLLQGIRERDARIAAHVETLEAQVADRTAELVVARDAAEQANAAKSDFLAVMSHEIRTPLNGILALSDLLAASDLPRRQQRHADVIAKSGRSLLHVINDILDFSKVEAGKMDLESIPMDLAEIAEDVASLFSEKAQAKGLDLAVFVDPRLPAVLGDPTRLRQVLSNLANNAIKFTDTGGVLIAAYRDPRAAGRIMLAVRDTGPGIPQDRLDTLFEAFTQVDQTTTRKHGGTGLGLAICDRLVKAMGGEWRLNSAIGRGSNFGFSIPLSAAQDAPAMPRFRPDWRVAVRIGGQTGKALNLYLQALGVTAVDDEADARFVETAAGADLRATVVVRDTEAAAEATRLDHPGACVLSRPLRGQDVVLLLNQMHDGQSPALDEAPSRQSDDPVFPGLRVLVVDDSEVNREVACEALAQLQVETFTAADGADAVERLGLETFDLVLMDGSMPILDGFEATRRIRIDEAASGRARAIIVALTAHVVGAGAQAWRDCGMDDVVHKPFTLDDLRRVLARFHPERATAPQDRAAPAGSPATSGATVPASGVDPALFDPVVRRDLLAMAEGGRADFVDRVHALYLENAPLRLAEAVAAAARGDGAEVARAAHALKSMSLSLGARAVAAEAMEVESKARDASAPSLSALEAAVGATIAALAADRTSSISMADQLDAALRQGALHVVYQPIFERTGVFSGKVEALVRWTEADGTRRFPDEFIPKLEAEGAVARLTDFVLERAMTETRDRPDLRVSVNASASEFQEAGFARRVSDLARRLAFPASRLEVEVTETAMLDISRARTSVEALRSAGFGVALDDFGAGYTSLHALRELKFTTLKIDRSFVERCCMDTASAAIIHAVVGVGRALGMKVVCEGVETGEQADFLRVAGAHYLQGYHFQKPVSLRELPAPAQAA